MMKDYFTKKRASVLVALALAVIPVISFNSCDKSVRLSKEESVPLAPESAPELTPEAIARMLSEIPLTNAQLREVWTAVKASSENGYDEEYSFADMVACPGRGTGDAMLATKAPADARFQEPLRDLISTNILPTRAGGFLSSLAESGLQLYWPYSEDWDGRSMPAITFDPEDGSERNVGFLREQLPDGGWIVRELMLDEEYAKSHPVWVVNRNEDAGHLTLNMLEKIHGRSPAPAATETRATGSFKTLTIKEFKAHRNYDSWFAGASEFFVKCGSLEGFRAEDAADIRHYNPSITDFLIVVKRRQTGHFLRFNAVLVAEWTDQLQECVFLMIEDDGGRQTSWEARGSVKVKSKTYGFDVKLPLRSNDDIVWRGKLSSGYFERSSGRAARYGDVSIIFDIAGI